jgi:glycerate-2-kinase
VDTRQLLTSVFLDAVVASNAEAAVRRSLEVDPLGVKEAVVIASGKAAAAMARGLAAVVDIIDGVAVTTVEDSAPVPVIVAGHPEPNSGSVAGARRALELATAAGENTTVVCLVSGGSSALLSVPAGGLTLDDLVATTRLLVASGADIGEMNTVRKHLSGIKGGRLAAAVQPARLITLVVSDVPGDALDVIGSGPTVPDPTSYADAVEVLKRYRLLDRVPDRVVEHLDAGSAGLIGETPKQDHPDHEIRIVAGSSTATSAAVEAARQRGLTAEVVTSSLSGEARHAAVEAVGTRRAGVDLLVFAGETTVSVTGPGRGGRNQEAALAAAMAIEESTITFLAGDTDGIDGATAAAGAIVDSGTIGRGREAGRDAVVDLENNDSHRYLRATGDLLITGPSGTNVADLWLVHHGLFS